MHAINAFKRAVFHPPTDHIKRLFIYFSGNDAKSHFDLLSYPNNKCRSFESKLERARRWSGRWWRKFLFFQILDEKQLSLCQKSVRISVVLFLGRNVKTKQKQKLHMILEERENPSQSHQWYVLMTNTPVMATSRSLNAVSSLLLLHEITVLTHSHDSCPGW